ncbi:MAG: primosomal protein N' [Ruminococcaceae bacterium]|nr:primosomal protein N' [Oscillospiraceae bacterium]
MEAYTNTVGVRLLDLPFYHLDREYFYYVPDTLCFSPAIGDFAVVPFGGANKKHIALITSVGKTNDYGKLKPVLAQINRSLSLTEEMMELIRFLCGRTLCTMGDAVRRLIPADAFAKATEFFSPKPIEPCIRDAFSVRMKAVFAFIESHAPVREERLTKEFGTDVSPILRKLLSEGHISSELTIKESKGASTELIYPVSDADTGILLKPRTPEAQRKLFSRICEEEYISSQTLLAEGYTSAQIKALVKKGLIQTEKKEFLRNHYGNLSVSPSELKLSEEQQQAFETLAGFMEEHKPHAALLHGVTGSGKTSVVLALCEKALSMKRKAVILIPEIALTWQSVEAFTSRFGKRIAVMHSGLSDGERFDAYKRIRRGDIDIVLGTRSAIFAPISDIGLIVIDEEQESAYKSDMPPKYHARDIAKHRAAANNSLLLMASATPSVESRREAEKGNYSLVRLTKRYTGSALPTVKIVDMRKETLEGEAQIGSELRALLCENFENGKQSMLFLNRRGFHSMLSCHACGETLLCPNCSVSLTHHKTAKGSRLICHYCGHSIPIPHFCPKCASEHLGFGGYGTQLIEEEIKSFLPNAKILRMDADTTKERFSQDEITGAFSRGEADILVGTQMIAKGHNFPKLSLVGVVAADNSLFLDDFRANERTFSLITQVIGRAGRSEGGGIAVIQTYNPDNETIRLSAKQDYDAFYKNEIAVRKALVFPPFCDIAVFSIGADEETELRNFAKEFSEALDKKQKTAFSDVKMLTFGPFEAPVFKIKNKFRMRIVIKFKNNKRTRALFEELLLEYGKKAAGKISLSVDINPSGT